MTKTPTPDEPRPALDPIKEAEQVRDALSVALHGAGIVLPSLGVDPLTYAEDTPRPLLDLGRCNLRTARRLVAALGGPET